MMIQNIPLDIMKEPMHKTVNRSERFIEFKIISMLKKNFKHSTTRVQFYILKVRFFIEHTALYIFI